MTANSALASRVVFCAMVFVLTSRARTVSRWEHVELLVLEGADVLGANLRLGLDLVVAEPTALARLAEGDADLEHAEGPPGRRKAGLV